VAIVKRAARSFSYVSLKHFRRHQETSRELIGLDLSKIDALRSTRATLRNVVAVVYMHVLARLVVVPQYEVRNLVRDGEPLTIGMMVLVHANRRRPSLRDEQTGNLTAQVRAYNRQA